MPIQKRPPPPPPAPPPLYAAAPHWSSSLKSQLSLFSSTLSPSCPVVRNHDRLRTWPLAPAAGMAANPQSHVLEPQLCLPSLWSAPTGLLRGLCTCPRLPSHEESLRQGWTPLYYSQLLFTCGCRQTLLRDLDLYPPAPRPPPWPKVPSLPPPPSTSLCGSFPGMFPRIRISIFPKILTPWGH